MKAGMPTGSNQQWVADITYIKVGNRYQRLITFMDLYPRRITGWSLRENRTADDVLALLLRVIERRQPRPGLVFHTDRGFEFMAYGIQSKLNESGLLRSNRLGFCTDNAHLEAFDHSLKGELLRGRPFDDERALKQALSSYIDGFYNRSWLHSGIDYCSPNDFERMAA